MAGESSQSESVEVPKARWPASDIPKSPWIEREKRWEAIGDGFEGGLIIGSAFNFGKGCITAKSSRFQSGLKYARANCIRTSGAFAAVLMMNSVLDTALLYYRQKDDLVNTFVSHAVPVAAITARHGPIISTCSGLAYGTYGALVHYYVPILEAKAEIRKSKANP